MRQYIRIVFIFAVSGIILLFFENIVLHFLFHRIFTVIVDSLAERN